MVEVNKIYDSKLGRAYTYKNELLCVGKRTGRVFWEMSGDDAKLEEETNIYRRKLLKYVLENDEDAKVNS